MFNRPDLKFSSQICISPTMAYGLIQSILDSNHQNLRRRMSVRWSIISHPYSAHVIVACSGTIGRRPTLSSAACVIGAESPELGLSHREDAQIKSRKWAWPINFALWLLSDPLSFRRLRSIGCISFVLMMGPRAARLDPLTLYVVKSYHICFKGGLEKSHYDIRLNESTLYAVNSDHRGLKILQPPSMLSNPRYQNSFCRGQERSFSSNSVSFRVPIPVVLCRLNTQICRGLSSSFGSLAFQGTVDHPSLDFTHPKSLQVAAVLLKSGTLCSPSYPQPEIASVPLGASSHQTLAWQVSVNLCLLLIPTITRLRYSYLQGRGHQVSFVSICLVCVWNSCWQVFVESIFQFAWSDLIHLLTVCFIESIGQIAWSKLIHLLAVCCNLVTEPNLMMVRYPSLNGRGHHLYLVSELLDWFRIIASNRWIHVTSFLWILASFSSFKKRVQFFPSSFLEKERTFPPGSSTMESVSQSSKVLNTRRAMAVLIVRSPLMVKELDLDFKSSIYEAFCQKFPVLVYDNHRYSIIYMLCTLRFVTSELNFGKEPPLVRLI